MVNKASLQSKRVLCVFAHPDDEAFGPGGTLIKWSQQGALIHLLCATKGEAGMNSHTAKRDEELIASSKILGIQNVEFMGYKDGTLCNNVLSDLENKIAQKINDFKPEIIMTFDFNGVSGHIDHIAVSSVVSQAFKKSNIPKELYYFTELKELSDQFYDYFIYFPPGKKREEVDVIIDISDVWDLRTEAMHKHRSQQADIAKITEIEKKLPKEDHFMVICK